MKILVAVLVAVLLVTSFSMTFMYGYTVFKEWRLRGKNKK